MPFFDGTDEELEAGLKEALLARFNRERRAGDKPPHTADIVDEDETVVMKLLVIDADTVKRVPNA